MERLSALAPVSDAYATLPVADAFTWPTAGLDEATGEWYLVAFRSVRREGADEDRLRAYDDRAHEEAAASPGFVFYYKGPAAPDRTCMSFCLWGSRAEARAAAGRPAHREAITVLGEMYESYRLEFLRVQRRAPWEPLEFEPYDPARQTAVS